LRKSNQPHFYLFRKVEGEASYKDVLAGTDNETTISDVKKDNGQCDQYNASGAIAFISYILAFLAVLMMVKNVSANKVPVVDGGVFGLILFAGVMGLITTVMIGDLFGHANSSLGYHFGLFTFAWCCFVVVGFTGMRANMGASQAQAAILVIALAAYAFSMGNNWYVRDQQKLYVPLNKDWNIKAGTFFIEPAIFGYIFSSVTKEELEVAMKETFNVDNIGECDSSNKGCVADPTISATAPFFPAVDGFLEVGLWNTCHCKNTLSVECSIFGSEEIMFNGQTDDCNNFNVARALILITGILALFSLVLASALIGGLRKANLHRTSNSLAILSAFTGFIASILYGAVMYDVDDLGRDYAIFMAGWILCFIAGMIGFAVTSYYQEVENQAKVSPLVPQPQTQAPAQETTVTTA